MLDIDQSEIKTMVDLLSWRTSHQPDDITFSCLVDGETECVSLSNRLLGQQVRALAARLQAMVLPGERALLMYPTGLEFIAGFFACLYAGVIAVPAYPPRRSKLDSRLATIIADAEPKVVLTTKKIVDMLASQRQQEPHLASLARFVTDDDAGLATLPGDAAAWKMPAINGDTLAFLQYTSGSTGSPKGVMVSHDNLLSNLVMLQSRMQESPTGQGVMWLPLYHDLGLIGGVFAPLYVGGPMILMSPVQVMQKPGRWLQAMSRFKATISGGPNFAYDLCVERIALEDCAELDLSHWRVAFNGAESVRARTLERFTQKFARYGFSREAFMVSYGLAEATLIVSGNARQEEPAMCAVEKEALAQNKVVFDSSDEAQVLVGNGAPCAAEQVVIVQPETNAPCGPGQIGEVWVSGPNVTPGYWQQPALNREIFQAKLVSNDGVAQPAPYLRTGDLGFLRQGVLYITGRLKDVILIRGNNYYPQDIEQTSEESHPALNQGGSAAFSVDVEEQEQLIVAQEIQRAYLRQLNAAEVSAAIRRAISAQHQLKAHTILLLKPMALPKTSSGKMQRYLCKQQFLSGQLQQDALFVESLGRQ